MTQTLPISMLMLTADSALKPDSSTASGFIADNQLSQSDADMKEQGSGFSALLNGMVQPAQSGKAGFNARQIPAAASGLSAISAAMLQATAQEADSTDADDTALANSLLLQIALKNQNSDEADTDSDVNVADSDVIAVDGEAIADAAIQDEGAGDSNSLVAQQQDVLATQTANSKLDTSADSENTAETTEADVIDGDAVNSEKAKHAGSDPATVATQRGAVTSDIAVSGTSSGDKETTAQAQVKLQSGAKDQPTDVKLTDNEIILQQQSQIEDQPKPNSDRNSIGQSNADTAQSQAATASANITKPADITKPANVAKAGLASQATPALTAEPVAAVINGQVKVTANSKKDDKQPLISAEPEKASSSKTETASMLKNAVAEQGAQQQQQQGQAQAERQFSAMVAHNNTAKTATEPARVENSFAASLQAADSRQQTQTNKTVAKTATEQLKQALNLQQHDAAGQLRERVNLMVRQNIQIAEIRLDPVGLGQMQIKVDMQQEQANVQFIVQQPQAKELLEQQLPRLREMLQQQGIVLGEGSVQQQSQQERQLAERQQQQQNGQGRQEGSAEGSSADDGIQTQLKVAPTDRLVDYYA